MGWVLKKFQVGRYKFQVDMGGKTWKMRFKQSGKRHKTHRNKTCVKVEKLRGMFQCKTAFFNLGWKVPP